MIVLAESTIIDLDGTLFVQLALFFALLVVLRQWVFAPVLALISARETAIEGARDKALSVQNELGASAALYDEKLKAVRKAASVERDKLRDEGVLAERNMLEVSRKETALLLQSAQDQLNHEASAAQVSIDAMVPELAKNLLSRLTGRSGTAARSE